ncbi:hypothetical protein QFC19_000014 [Naganishia cerealis]|uniref:Uncharacterized protein n=1 Tax=Naganishia cerealis TaxID=610337 RepID=A0ACC2WRU8_9TREE|nr:hypothetical protein QFC19_000014 [Naganishia cerealis]
MVRKQLDQRIPDLIRLGVANNQRTFFAIIGDHGRDQIVSLHYLLSQSRTSARPNVLWCYKKELGFTSHRKKREKKIKNEVKRGIREVNEQNPFEMFIAVTDIRYTYYKESHKVLGQTFGFLVLQDFEALTPNLLARTIETVEGGGIVVLLLKDLKSLKQVYNMTMDVHSRYRTEAHTDVQPRFNERFILSLGSCPNCLFLDDELNVLPISEGKNIKYDEKTGPNTRLTLANEELSKLKEQLKETKTLGPLSKLCATTDQLKALLTFWSKGEMDRKSLSNTISLTAGRGRGKSAALGLALAAAIKAEYHNIFVTSPTPENLKTLFEFVIKGLNALGYEETTDYEVVRSNNEDWGRAVVRITVQREKTRQFIQYIQPQDSYVLGQAELLVIDEAAAIPLPLVRKLLGPYLTFMASTINGYEGTGRSLSIKLINQLREQSRAAISQNGAGDGNAVASNSTTLPVAGGRGGAGLARILSEVKLDQPIRYGQGDPVEKWLNGLLCLDVSSVSRSISGCPHPSQCELYYVNRDTLFSYHPASEVFLQRMMSLYVASHYKNSPNDLQLMSDAPAHHLFVLLPPLKEDESTLPDPLVVIQVALEGNISRASVMAQLAKGVRSGGDLIPWLMSQQFQDDDFASLSGARVVRIATHPDYARMGYGKRALESLSSFYSGDLLNLDEIQDEEMTESYAEASRIDKDASLHTDQISIRDVNKMPPLLQRLSERRPERLDYLGVSFGLTRELLGFWKQAGYVPMYVRQTANDLTGEHTCVMLKKLFGEAAGSDDWLHAFAQDFRKRFLQLLSYQSFRQFTADMASSVVEAAKVANSTDNTLTLVELRNLMSPFDLKRIESYSNNLLDYHVVLDLLPDLARMYFTDKLGQDVTMSATQKMIMLALGLQRKAVEDIATEMRLEVNQCLAYFVKTMRKISKHLKEVQKKGLGVDIPEEAPEVRRNLPTTDGEQGTSDWKPLAKTVEQDLDDVVDEETKKTRALQRELIDSMDLAKYAIDDGTDWSDAQAQVQALATARPEDRKRLSTVVSVKAAGQKADINGDEQKKTGAKRKASIGGSGSKNDRQKMKKRKST